MAVKGTSFSKHRRHVEYMNTLP